MLSNFDARQLLQTHRVRVVVLDERVDLARELGVASLVQPLFLRVEVKALEKVLVQVEQVADLLVALGHELSDLRVTGGAARLVAAVARVGARGALHVVVRVLDEVGILDVLADPRLVVQVEAGHDGQMHELEVFHEKRCESPNKLDLDGEL